MTIFFTIVLALAAPATHLSIQPWTGADFQTTTTAAAKYRLEVSGRPNALLHLRARGVSPGWIAAFCTPRLCSPQRLELALPPSGEAVVQFELIREAADAPTSGSTVITDGAGATVSVPSAHRE